MAGPSPEIRDNPEQSRYELLVDGHVAGLVLYRLHDGRMTLYHTEVNPGHEGSGLGSTLAEGALGDVRRRSLQLEPLCPFIAGYIQRHPNAYLDLVIPEMQESVRSRGRAR